MTSLRVFCSDGLTREKKNPPNNQTKTTPKNKEEKQFEDVTLALGNKEKSFKTFEHFIELTIRKVICGLIDNMTVRHQQTGKATVVSADPAQH